MPSTVIVQRNRAELYAEHNCGLRCRSGHLIFRPSVLDSLPSIRKMLGRRLAIIEAIIASQSYAGLPAAPCDDGISISKSDNAVPQRRIFKQPINDSTLRRWCDHSAGIRPGPEPTNTALPIHLATRRACG